MKNLLSSIIMTIGMLSCASCTDLMKDDGSRGFANVATIVGDAENGFYCYQRHYAGLVVSHSKELAGKERGYFNFYYTEDDWTTSTNGMKYIDNAQVYTIEAYETVHPLTQEEADAGHITGNENCTIPQSLSIDYASYGYVDLQAGFSTFNHINGEIHNGEVNLVYDATKQEPDTLRLQLCYNPRIPDGWTKTSHHFRTVSCDISSLSSLSLSSLLPKRSLRVRLPSYVPPLRPHPPLIFFGRYQLSHGFLTHDPITFTPSVLF